MIGFLIALMIPVVAILKGCTSRATKSIHFRDVAAILACASIAGTACYMFLANCNLVLYTGKNIFLFGLNSWSDAALFIVLLSIGTASLVGITHANLRGADRDAG